MLISCQFTLGLLVGCLLFVPWEARRDHFALRAMAGLAGLVVGNELLATLSLPTWLRLTTLTLLVLLWVLLCFRCDVVRAIFTLTCGYTVQHMTSKVVYMLAMLLLAHLGEFPSNPAMLALLAAANVIVCVPIWHSFTRPHLLEGELRFNRVKTVLLAAAFLLAAIFLSSVLEDTLDVGAETYLVSYLCLNGLCVLLAVTVLSLELANCSIRRLEGENEVLERLLEEDRVQYERERQNMEQINIRYHDLKQQYTRALPDEREELESEMRELRPLYHTGSKALDIVLGRKTAACEDMGIQLVCSADGTALAGMRSYHVYSLFGNALDNAIECLERVHDRTRRVIRLDVERVRDMTLVRIENYTPDDPVVKDGELLTTKEDSAGHGYGMKSIRNVADMYGGSAEFFVEEHLFRLVVTLPLAAAEEAPER